MVLWGGERESAGHGKRFIGVDTEEEGPLVEMVPLRN